MASDNSSHYTEDRVRRKTFFLDIDGTLVYHKKDLHRMITEDLQVLKGVLAKLQEWRSQDHYIVLTTARPQGARSRLEEQLAKAGIFYDQLIMGLPVGPRYIINDRKPCGLTTAHAITLDRNKGIGEVVLL